MWLFALLKKNGRRGGLEGLVWVVEIEGGDFGGELTGPERERSVRSIRDRRSSDIAGICDDNLVLVKSENSGWVRKGELMEGFNDGDERLGEHNHAWVIDCTKDFLKLSHGGDEEKAGMSEKFIGTFGEKVDTITGEEEGF